MAKQCKLMSEPVNAIDVAIATRERLSQELDEAQIKAHRNLTRYKFNNFGYWAAIWIHLNRVGQFNRPNPFTDYVKLASKKGGQND